MSQEFWQAAGDFNIKKITMKIEKIFLVDDEEITNAIQTRIVKTEFPHMEIVKFERARELIDILRKINYEVLLFLDLNMPGMDAIDVLSELDNHSLAKNPVIFILTYSRNQKEISRVKNHALVKDVIFKPINATKINKVKTMIEF